MEEKNLYPNWFKTLFILIGVWCLSKEFARPVEVISNLSIVICFPLILLVIMFMAKTKKISFGKGSYFFNISISILVFFVFILIAQYRSHIEYIGKLIGGHFSIVTDYSKTDFDEYGKPYAPDKITTRNSESGIYYYGAYVIYFLVLVYFAAGTWFLSKRIKSLTDKIIAGQKIHLMEVLNKYSADKS